MVIFAIFIVVMAFVVDSNGEASLGVVIITFVFLARLIDVYNTEICGTITIWDFHSVQSR